MVCCKADAKLALQPMEVTASTSKILIALGLILALLGLLLLFYPRALLWLGQLPGDLRLESKSYRVYFPIVSSVVFSILLSIMLWAAKRFMQP